MAARERRRTFSDFSNVLNFFNATNIQNTRSPHSASTRLI